MAYLENDDEERDLDKETVIPDEAYDSNQAYQQKRNSRGSKGGNKSFTPRKEIVVPENRMFLSLDKQGLTNFLRSS